jgi:hypothetical protein
MSAAYSPADEILPRLDGLRQTGADRWISRCPAHEDKSPSLAIRDAGDRLLLHCFAGCSIYDITSALGINLRDLFADGITDRTRLHDDRRLPARDALALLSRETHIAWIAAHDTHAGRTLTEADLVRLDLAVGRIGVVLDAAGVRR